MGRIPNLMEFAESLGFEFELSEDGLLIIHAAEAWEWFGSHLREHEDGIKSVLRFREELKVLECRGGPCDGRRIPFYEYAGKPILVHLGRACWAVYCMVHYRGPALWVGYATSAKKGRALAREWHAQRKRSEAT